jgi:uncharacterized protein (DUF305 family)
MEPVARSAKLERTEVGDPPSIGRRVFSKLVTVSIEIGLVVLVTIGMVLPLRTASAEVATGCNAFTTSAVQTEATPAVPGDPAATTSDLAILDSMLVQHARAMSLANLGLQYAQDSQVRRMALRIAEGHAGEIQLLRSWRSSWFPEATNIVVSSATPAIVESIAPDCIGDTFDRAFLSSLRAELHTEVDQAKSAQLNATHPELRDFAASLINVRTDEISSIDKLLAMQ